jgi:tripartite-type tricarboxylate transporter receptor subunit TctC
MGGEINMAATSAMSAVAAVKTGKVRAITSLGQKRVAVMPDLPTLGEQGYPNVSVTNQYNIWVPAKTPPAIIATLNQVISGGMNSPDIEKQLLSRGSEAVDPMPPKQLKVEIERDYADIQKSVKELGLTF